MDVCWDCDREPGHMDWEDDADSEEEDSVPHDDPCYDTSRSFDRILNIVRAIKCYLAE